MSEEYRNITLTIQGSKVAVQFKRGQAKPDQMEEQAEERLQYQDLLLDSDMLDLKVLDFCRKLIENDRIQSRVDFQLIGRLLHKALFTEKVKESFNLLRGITNPTSEKRLRVELEFKGNDNLGLFKLPWEYLCYQDDQDSWKFVSTVAELVLTRYLPPKPSAQQLIVAIDDKKINVLLVVLNPDPDGLGNLAAVEKEVSDQLDKLKQSLSQHKVEVVVDNMAKPVTWECFKKAIDKPDCRPHILHLIAHGRFLENTKGRSGEIAFHLYDRPDEIEVGIEGGNIDWVPDRDFVNAFVTATKLPRFAFLHMCEGGVIDKHDSSAGVALRLAQEGVPAVVAMQHPIEINTSTIFSQSFYESLEAGWTIDEAVQLSRAKIAEQYADNRAFGTPVLYMSTRSDFILPKIPKPFREPQAKSFLITIIEYQQHLIPIFLKYQNEEGLKAEDMTSLEQKLRHLVNSTSDHWRSALDNEYKNYTPFNEVHVKLGKLCVELSSKIVELTRLS